MGRRRYGIILLTEKFSLILTLDTITTQKPPHVVSFSMADAFPSSPEIYSLISKY